MSIVPTHPWITFELDLRKAPYTMWLSLGEAESKCFHLRGVALLPETARDLHMIYLVKGAQATTAIEGNTLTVEEVQQRLEGKLKLPPSKAYLGQEVDNIIEACHVIANNLFANGANDLCVDDILGFNRLVLRGLEVEEGTIPGEIRNRNVGVGRYLAPPPDRCRELLDRLCAWMTDIKAPSDQYAMGFGILKAIVAHVYLAWIHPFGDGNGRTARLIEFHTLLSAGVPSAAAHLLSNHYNATRTEYYRQLDAASKSGGNLYPFIEYALQGFIDGLKEQITRVQRMQWQVLWERHLFNEFQDRETVVEKRCRGAVFQLSRYYFDQPDENPIPIADMRRLTPRMVELYYGKSDRTLLRDLEKLEEMGLLRFKGEGVEPQLEKLAVFRSAAIDTFSDDEAEG